MGEIYICCKDWKLKDGLFETLLYDFEEYTPVKGDFIRLEHETKGGNYLIIGRSFDFEEMANDKGFCNGMSLLVKKVADWL